MLSIDIYCALSINGVGARMYSPGRLIWLPRVVLSVVVPRFRESMGTLNLIRPSVPLSVRLSVRPSFKKTLTLVITFALLQIELWYLACVFLVTRPFRRYHVVTLTVTFDLLQGQICCWAGHHNSLNLLVFACFPKDFIGEGLVYLLLYVIHVTTHICVGTRTEEVWRTVGFPCHRHCHIVCSRPKPFWNSTSDVRRNFILGLTNCWIGFRRFYYLDWQTCPLSRTMTDKSLSKLFSILGGLLVLVIPAPLCSWNKLNDPKSAWSIVIHSATSSSVRCSHMESCIHTLTMGVKDLIDFSKIYLYWGLSSPPSCH